MEQFTLEEINFLRWLLESDTGVIPYVMITEALTEHQLELLASIREKLKGQSSY